MMRVILLNRADSINDLGVMMDSRISFSRHIDFTVGKALAMLGFVKRLSGKFRDPNTLRIHFVSLVLPNLEYACCVWRSFYYVHISRIERVQKNSLDTQCGDCYGTTCMIFLQTWTKVF
jgi:hypothetical protein